MVTMATFLVVKPTCLFRGLIYISVLAFVTLVLTYNWTPLIRLVTPALTNLSYPALHCGGSCRGDRVVSTIRGTAAGASGRPAPGSAQSEWHPTGSGRLMVVTPQVGRIGNQMFAYATMLGVSRARGMQPLMADMRGAPRDLAPVFQLSTPLTAAGALGSEGDWVTLKEGHANQYDPTVEGISANRDIKLVGYFQSWKYFQDAQDLVRREFTFNHSLTAVGERFIQDAIRVHYGPDTYRENVVVIGVHVRRGDMVTYANRGYTVADQAYLDKAITYFEEAFRERTKLFVVCSDPHPVSRNWSRSHVVRQRSPLVFSDQKDGKMDLALLAQCDHVIQTVGTFGWWSAWLAGGESTYYKQFPRAGSTLDRGYKREDYVPKGWVGL